MADCSRSPVPLLLLGGNKANQTFCHGQILPQGLPNICLNNSPQELKILIDFKMLARRDGEVGVAGKGGNYRRGANVYLPAAKPPQPLPSPGTGERGPGCSPPGSPRRRPRPLPRPRAPLAAATLRPVTSVPAAPPAGTAAEPRWQGWAPPAGEGIPVRAPRPHSGKNFDAIH